MADAEGEADALGEASVDAEADGARAARASADWPAVVGEAEPTVSVEGPQAAHSPAATTAAATRGSRTPRGAAERGCAAWPARTGRSMREVMAKTPQGALRTTGRASSPDSVKPTVLRPAGAMCPGAEGRSADVSIGPRRALRTS